MVAGEALTTMVNAAARSAHAVVALGLFLGLMGATALDAAELARDANVTQPAVAAKFADMPRGCDTPASERKIEAGCYTIAETSLGVLPSGSMFWHLYTYPSQAAAEAARGPKGTIVNAFGKHWVFTIEQESWVAPSGGKTASIGPLVVGTDKPYTARFMEGTFPPGSQPVDRKRPGHRHPGPEAWYVLTGAQCLETPNGLLIARAGGASIAPEGWPMAISDYGTETRRTLVLVLHPTAQPYVMAIDDPRSPGAPHSHWKPAGLCPKA
jgi:hypothetical protein